MICWRKLATNVAVCLRKGDPVMVKGRLSVRDYQDKEGRHEDRGGDRRDLGRPRPVLAGSRQFQRVRPQTGMTASEFAAAKDGGEEREPAMNGAEAGGNGAWGTGLAGASASAAGNDDGIPLPEEPDRPFFDESAIGDEGGARGGRRRRVALVLRV